MYVMIDEHNAYGPFETKEEAEEFKKKFIRFFEKNGFGMPPESDKLYISEVLRIF